MDRHIDTNQLAQSSAENHNERENPLRAEKRKKLRLLREKGIDPFPHSFKPTQENETIHKKYDHLPAGAKEESARVVVAGRLMTMRNMGKASFFHLQDQSGQMQIYLRLQELSEKDQIAFNLIDIGDIVGIEGYVFKTQKGELSIHAERFHILCKTLEPLPEKFHGVTDIEIKYRHRHLDLIMSQESREIFVMRSKIIREIRSFLDGKGFLEVETPVLQPIYGGAAAYPFSTHHRALDMKLFLKISPELYLKRLIVGGFHKVYEIGKNFRNEGIDRSHNPEFTMMEYYEAYTDYEDQMLQFEELVSTVCENIRGTKKIIYQDKELDFTPPWRRLGVNEGIKEYAGFDVTKMSDKDLLTKVRNLGGDLDDFARRGEMIMEVFARAVEPHLWQPTFVMDFPLEVSPLTKKHRSQPGLVERFEPMVAGMELGNAYTELNDPEDQYERLREQENLRQVDEEAQPMDNDFVHAIDVGMPPTGGVGLGVERLVMILTNQSSIRDIIFFPTMKHQ